MRQLRLSVVYISGYITIEDENVCFNSISLHKENVFAFLLIFNLIRSHRCFFYQICFYECIPKPFVKATSVSYCCLPL